MGDIGATLVNLHLDATEGPERFAEALRPTLEMTAQAGLKLALENTVWTGPADFNAFFEVLRGRDDLPSAHAGMCLDLGHANLFGEFRHDTWGYLDALDPAVPIIHLHLHENWGDRDSHLTLFTGPSRENPAGRSAMAEVLITVRNYVKEYPILDRPGLLFTGNPGTGKTHLAVAALRQLIGRGFEGIFFDYQNLLERIRAGYDPTSGVSSREAYQIALDAEILLLDDLGAHRVTDWVEDTITAIITYRCNNRKALIATTNLRDPETGDRRSTGLESDVQSKYFLEERIGMRARSRLFEMCRVVRMPTVEDYRMRRR